MTTDPDTHRAFGVFKPVGHLLISFPSDASAREGQEAVQRLGIADGDIHTYTNREMLAQIDADLDRASPLAAIGQELNLVKAHRVLAERGYHWLLVKADGDDDARRIADACREAGAERAQHYGRFIIEDMIQHPDDLPQVNESPDRGLDARTPSGLEAERAQLRTATDAAGTSTPR